MAGTTMPKTVPAATDAASTAALLLVASIMSVELWNIQKPTMILNMKTASTQFRAVRWTMRSVTWPELRSSLITRMMVAGEVDMASEASSSAVIEVEPNSMPMK